MDCPSQNSAFFISIFGSRHRGSAPAQFSSGLCEARIPRRLAPSRREPVADDVPEIRRRCLTRFRPSQNTDCVRCCAASGRHPANAGQTSSCRRVAENRFLPCCPVQSVQSTPGSPPLSCGHRAEIDDIRSRWPPLSANVEPDVGDPPRFTVPAVLVRWLHRCRTHRVSSSSCRPRSSFPLPPTCQMEFAPQIPGLT